MGTGSPIRADIAVVGLGAAGAAALWQLARAGCNVVGIEQFSLAHDRCSSRLHAPVASAGELDRQVREVEIERIRDIVRQRLPALKGPIASKVYMYPMSKDGHFIVDRMPSSERVIVCAGLSGHGFKFATALGEALAALALDRRPAVDIDFLSLSRFG